MAQPFFFGARDADAFAGRAAFFAGARTAEDTAAAIQSRAEIYMAEQSA